MARLFLGLLLLFLVTGSDAFQIIGGSVTVVEGGPAVFPCYVIDTTDRLEQISWQRLTRLKTKTDNFFTITSKGPTFVNGHDHRFEFVGDFSNKNGTLKLSDVTLSDEGTYTCVFSLFRSGNYQTGIPLGVLVPPITSLKESDLTLGDEEVVLATCTAAGSRPPTKITWLTGALGKKVRTTTNSTVNADGTTTTVSVLFGVPSREISNHTVKCLINHEVLSEEETLSFTIEVHSPPLEVNITERSANVFECQTGGHPTPDVTWSRPDKPGTLRGAEGSTLRFTSLSSDLNGHYVCEATNAHGKQRGLLVFRYTSESCPACWTLFSLLLLSNVAAAAAGLYFYKTGKLLWKEEDTAREMRRVPTSASSSEGNRVMHEEENEVE